MDNEQILLQIIDVNRYGEGIGRTTNNMVVFVPGAISGELVGVQIYEKHKKYSRGKMTRIVQGSPQRVATPCPKAGYCGGCQMQHIAYPEQLRIKTTLVKQNMARIGRIHMDKVLDVIGMSDPWYYRNNIRLKVMRQKEGYVLGFFAASSHRIEANLRQNNNQAICLLAHSELNQVVQKIGELLKNNPSPELKLEEIMLRRSNTGEIMVLLIGKSCFQGTSIAQDIAQIPEISTLIQYSPMGKKAVRAYRTLTGTGYISDYIGEFIFRVSAASFYQVNPTQTALLYAKALDYCAVSDGAEIADVYCGVGAMAIFAAASRAKMVRGYEINPQAISDAKANAKLNKLANTSFFIGPAEQVFSKQVEQGYKPQTIILNPPRSGCKPQLLSSLAQSKPGRIVYVSCDPATLARDINTLQNLGFILQEVQPVDLFPHTGHVECVCLLTTP